MFPFPVNGSGLGAYSNHRVVFLVSAVLSRWPVSPCPQGPAQESLSQGPSPRILVGAISDFAGILTRGYMPSLLSFIYLLFSISSQQCGSSIFMVSLYEMPAQSQAGPLEPLSIGAHIALANPISFVPRISPFAQKLAPSNAKRIRGQALSSGCVCHS